MKYLLVLLLVVGCVHPSVKASAQYEALLNPMLGNATEEQVVRMWGPPTQASSYGQSRFLTYYWSYGSGGTVIPAGQAYLVNSHSRYDQVFLEFRNGVLVSWKGNINR